MNVLHLKRRMIVFFAAMVSICFIGVSAKTFTVKAADPVVLSDVVMTMEEGANARVDGHNGVRFTASMSKAHYEGLKANTDYQKVVFGMVIAPADYLEEHGALNVANLFTNPVYDWAVWNGSAWVYTPDTENPKTRIICFDAAQMTEKDGDDDTYVFNRSITAIQTANIARDFVGLGFVGVSEDGTNFEYKMATYYDGDVANNTRSAALVATRAIADDDLDSTQKQWLTENYLENSDVVTDNSGTSAGEYKNYEEDNDFDVTGLGTISRITYANGVEITDFTQNGNTLTVASGITGVPSGDTILYIYSKVNSAYKLFKVKVDFDVKTMITTVAELDAARAMTSGDIILMNDLTLEEPLTERRVKFDGTFDGNGHVIENLAVTTSGAGGSEKFSGLYYAISSTGTVKNLGIKNASYSTSAQTGIVTKLLQGGTIDNVCLEYSCANSNTSGGITQQVTASSAITNSTVFCSSSTMGTNDGLLVGFGTTSATLDLTGTKAIKMAASATLVGAREDGYATFRDAVNNTDTDENPISLTLRNYDFYHMAPDDQDLFFATLSRFAKVTDKSGLEAMRTAANSGTDYKYYVLMNDIDLNSKALADAPDNFYAVFDGNGHAIKKMLANDKKKGLCYNLRYNVKNLAIVDATISGQTGSICYSLTSSGVIDNVYISIAGLNADAAAAITRNTSSSGTETVRNCVMYVKSTNRTATFTRAYADGTTFVGKKVGFLCYYCTTAGIKDNLINVSSVSDLTDIQTVAITSNSSDLADDNMKALLSANPIIPVNTFKSGVNGGTITGYDSTLLGKIISLA